MKGVKIKMGDIDYILKGFCFFIIVAFMFLLAISPWTNGKSLGSNKAATTITVETQSGGVK